MTLRSFRPTAVVALLAVLVSAWLPGAGSALGQGPGPLPAGEVARRPAGDVFGYLPYWEIDGGTDAYLHYDVLSTIALFGVAFRPDGSFTTSDAGYAAVTGDTAAAILQHAHRAGVRVVVTFESFNAASNAAFLSDTNAQGRFIAAAADLVTRLGADGASIDIEGLSGAYFGAYGTFVGALARTLRDSNPAAQVSVAVNSNVSGAAMASAALSNGADRAFIMAYNYRSADSDPVGSIAPLVRTDGGQSITTTLDTFAARGVPAEALILGLPFYGLAWSTEGTAIPADRVPASFGQPGVFYPSSLPELSAGATVGFDTREQSAVLTRWDDGRNAWRQIFYDDPASLAPKMQLALRRGLAGVGIWALGYDRGQPGYWELIASLHRGLEVTAASVAPSPAAAKTVTVRIVWNSAAKPVNGVRLSNDAAHWSPWLKPAARLPWSLGAASNDGRRTVYVQARDAGGALSTIRPVDTVLDRSGPTMQSLALAWSKSAQKWVSSFRATDVAGVARYQFRYRVGSLPWRLLERSPLGTAVRIGVPSSKTVTVQVRAQDVLGRWSPWSSIRRP